MIGVGDITVALNAPDYILKHERLLTGCYPHEITRVKTTQRVLPVKWACINFNPISIALSLLILRL
jgi:hypothetical protein